MKATTEAGGEPRMASSGREVLMKDSIFLAHETMDRQDSR